ncbi:MAG: MBL fold metallo-hydrolase [Spirochaetales bacterium]|nr:MBL fold metallo-hydrolase [Spirochaetales bacterium]
MKIKSWGVRGSLPTPGKQGVKYGGNTTCIELTTNAGNTIIIDAGSGLRLLGKRIIKSNYPKEMVLLLTHAHWDHLMGFPFFIPAYFDRFKIYVRGGKFAKKSLHKYLRHQMEPPYFPVDFKLLQAEFDFKRSTPKILENDPIEIHSINLNHPDGGFGYKFIEDGKVFVFLTDNELGHHHKNGPSFDEFRDFCKDADLLFHDAQYTDEQYKITKGWGHSTFDMTVSLGLAANVKRLGFCHHDVDRTDEDLDSLVAKYQKTINCFGVEEESEIIL